MLSSFLFASLVLAQGPTVLGPESEVTGALAPTSKTRFEVSLQRGQSALVNVVQEGVDVVVDVFDPSGRLLDSFDSPNGRNGTEVVDFIAGSPGAYSLVVRPYDANEPAGRFRLKVLKLRSVSDTASLLASRKAQSLGAAEWLRQQSVPLSGPLFSSTLDRLAKDAQVVGLGEATHGSNEFNKARFAITKRLVERDRFRIVAVEYSASRTMQLEPFWSGRKAADRAALRNASWIGWAHYPHLIAWIRTWNLRHPKDTVRFVGVDSGDNAFARHVVDDIVRRTYTGQLANSWRLARRELEDADRQNAVFGDSSVDPRARETLVQLQRHLEAERPALVKRFGSKAVTRARESLAILLDFSDYNSGAPKHNRDWYMARAIERHLHGGHKAVYWAHNAHVAVSATGSTAGSNLRAVLGRGYLAIAQTAASGSFVAQRPNDLADRLEVSKFLRGTRDSVETALAQVRPGPFLAWWPGRGSEAPAFLRQPLPMRWIGGLYLPGGPPSSQYSLYNVPSAFDGIIFHPSVTAIPMPPARPIVPARVRRYGTP